MFEELQDSLVRLMLDLSREKLNDPDGLRARFEECDKKAFFELCLEHELDGVVASHIIENRIAELPDYWMEAYSSEKEHLTFLRDKAAEICARMDENGIRMVAMCFW